MLALTGPQYAALTVNPPDEDGWPISIRPLDPEPRKAPDVAPASYICCMCGGTSPNESALCSLECEEVFRALLLC